MLWGIECTPGIKYLPLAEPFKHRVPRESSGDMSCCCCRFEIIFFFSALSQMLVDQSYWQSAIAARASCAVKVRS